ncbi:LacI family DNA-binding transcriptional regulator [Ruegeria sp. HKCCD8929]|uniref:LacI family DNA-binding transcriptional regulator n=1 Tax=Ruegeria sp. HKCCD8929 TaxID=2683006 RepID=UPI0014890D96|nr:LacI family DNA-binding transcriptional regulator [Ruegeria sp. HKCCD8929]
MGQRKFRNMDEFAKASGISRPTLSKYFNDPESVRQSTRQRIEKALKQYDYRPNFYAMNQNRRTTKSIGIVVPNLADPFFNEISRAIELACVEAGYNPIVLSSHGRTHRERENLEALKSLRPAGVLLAPFGRESDEAYIRNYGKDVPLVLFDADVVNGGEAFVGIDNYQTIDLIVKYLFRSGEPPCFFEMETPSNPNANKRHQAFVEAMDRIGHPTHIFKAKGEGWDFEEIGKSEGGRMLAESAFPTNTILCSNDRLAIGLLSAAYQQGIRVGHGPECSLRIAGHDDHPFSRFTCPSLTTIAQDYTAIAETAVATLFKAIESEQRSNERSITLFGGSLVMRDSA